MYPYGVQTGRGSGGFLMRNLCKHSKTRWRWRCNVRFCPFLVVAVVVVLFIRFCTYWCCAIENKTIFQLNVTTLSYLLVSLTRFIFFFVHSPAQFPFVLLLSMLLKWFRTEPFRLCSINPIELLKRKLSLNNLQLNVMTIPIDTFISDIPMIKLHQKKKTWINYAVLCVIRCTIKSVIWTRATHTHIQSIRKYLKIFDFSCKLWLSLLIVLGFAMRWETLTCVY